MLCCQVVGSLLRAFRQHAIVHVNDRRLGVYSKLATRSTRTKMASKSTMLSSSLSPVTSFCLVHTQVAKTQHRGQQTTTPLLTAAPNSGTSRANTHTHTSGLRTSTSTVSGCSPAGTTIVLLEGLEGAALTAVLSPPPAPAPAPAPPPAPPLGAGDAILRTTPPSTPPSTSTTYPNTFCTMCSWLRQQVVTGC